MRVAARLSASWLDAVRTILELWTVEQQHEERSPYRYPELLEVLRLSLHNGRGSPVGYTGMTRSVRISHPS